MTMNAGEDVGKNEPLYTFVLIVCSANFKLANKLAYYQLP
jgi:hypothetical protein